MELFFALVIFGTIAAVMAVGLGILALDGGPVVRWVAAGLLVVWLLWVGEIVIRNTYPRLFYNAMERVYMDGLIAAISTGSSRIPLEKVVPYPWVSVCLVQADYRGPDPDALAAAERLAGHTIRLATGSHWLDSIGVDYTELFMVFVTGKEFFVIQDRSGNLHHMEVGKGPPKDWKQWGYEVDFEFKHEGPCYVRDEVMVKIQPAS